MVYPLLPDQDTPSFETNLAESFLVIALHVLSKAVHIGESMFGVTVLYQTLQVTKLHSFGLGLCILIIDRVVFLIAYGRSPQLVVKLVPSELLV